MSLSSKLPHPMVSGTFIASVVILQYLLPGILADTDVSWHIAAGDYIRGHSSIPVTDPWSYTAAGAPWYNLSWLWDIGLSFLVSLVGLLNTRGVIILMAAGLMALVCSNLMARKTIGEEALIYTLLAVGLTMTDFVNARPQMVSFFFILLSQRILHASRESEKYGALLFLPIISCLWANTHGGVLVLFTMLGAYGLEALISNKNQWFIRLFFVSVLCLVTLFINPYGFSIIDGMLRTLHSAGQKYISEWVAFQLGLNGLSLFVIMFLFLSDFKNPAMPISDRVLSFMWLLATFMGIRNGSIFALIAAPYVGFHMQQLAEKVSSKSKNKPAYILPARKNWALLATLAVSISALAVLFTPIGAFIRPHASLTPATTLDTIEFVEQNYPGAHFVNDYAIGGMLLYEGQGRLPVFIDGRAGTAYGEEVIEDYYILSQAATGIKEKIIKYNILGYVLASSPENITRMEKIASRTSGKWTKVFAGKDSLVYLYQAEKYEK